MRYYMTTINIFERMYNVGDNEFWTHKGQSAMTHKIWSKIAILLFTVNTISYISFGSNYSINHEINLFYIIILSIWILEIVSFVMIFESSHLLLRRHAIIYTKPKSNLFWFHIWSLPKECNGSSIQYKSHLRYQPWVIPSLV